MKSLDGCGMKLNVLQSVRFVLVLTFSLTSLSCTTHKNNRIEWEAIKKPGTTVSFELPRPVKSSPNKSFYESHKGSSHFRVQVCDYDNSEFANVDLKKRENLKAALDALVRDALKLWKKENKSASNCEIISDGKFESENGIGKQYLVKQQRFFPPGDEIVVRFYVTPEKYYIFQVSSKDTSNPEVTHFLDSIKM